MTSPRRKIDNKPATEVRKKDARITLTLQLQSLFSGKALAELYRRRRLAEPASGMRDHVNMSLSLMLLFLTVTALVVISWVPQNIDEYVKSRDFLRILDSAELNIRATAPIELSCDGPEDCRQKAQASTTLNSASTEQIDALANNEDKIKHSLIRFNVSSEFFKTFGEQRSAVLALPRYRFHEATIFINGSLAKNFLMSERLYVVLDLEKHLTKEIEVDLLIKFDKFQRTLSGVRNGESFLLAAGGEYERYINFLNSRAEGFKGKTGVVAKVAIAMFCLLLFLIIDSSPESLGLALFMGFEAAAIAIGEGWIVLGPFAAYKGALTHFCYQMGDIMKLYFMLQIARISQKGATFWIVAGTILSIPYAVFREYAALQAWNWAYLTSLWRDTLVGTLGGLACFRVAWSLKGQKLPWRMTALVLAGTAGFGEVVASWTAHSNANSIYPAIQTLYTIIQGNVGYIFALSTFINISTLENRVRSLSIAQARAQEIERELDIARSVQRSLLLPPKLPDGVSLSCYQEAALYVSGDTYFVNYDKQQERFTFLLNDVTGHGIQAALKASACNVLAKTLWGRSNERGEEPLGTSLRRFDAMTQEVLVEADRTPDFNSLIAAEFDLRGGELSIYRSNFSFPILIRPHVNAKNATDQVLGEFWSINLVTTPNQQIFTMPIPRGTFLMFLSDGFLESSRDLKKFTSYLRRRLATYGGEIHVNTLNELALGYEGFAVNIKNDDRTILIFQWEFPEAHTAAPSARPSNG